MTHLAVASYTNIDLIFVHHMRVIPQIFHLVSIGLLWSERLNRQQWTGSDDDSLLQTKWRHVDHGRL